MSAPIQVRAQQHTQILRHVHVGQGRAVDSEGDIRGGHVDDHGNRLFHIDLEKVVLTYVAQPVQHQLHTGHVFSQEESVIGVRDN